MKKSILSIAVLLSAINLHAFTDSDLDGVEDAFDKCPNTPLMDIVDLSGCTKKSLITQESDSQSSPHHFDIIVGSEYSATDYNSISRSDTVAASLQLDYYYKDFSLQIYSSYYAEKDDDGYSNSGLYDTFVGASYLFRPMQDVRVYIGGGVLLPTYKTSLQNNNTDYKLSLSANYDIGAFTLFGGYSYTFIGDDDVTLVTDDASYRYAYHNTNSLSGGLGYYATSRLYTSLSYFQGESIYVGYERIKSVSLYAYYSIDANWFLTANYARGLSDTATDNYLALRLGYFF